MTSDPLPEDFDELLDELLDVLNEFPSKAKVSEKQPTNNFNDEEFARSLAKGMEELLNSLDDTQSTELPGNVKQHVDRFLDAFDIPRTFDTTANHVDADSSSTAAIAAAATVNSANGGSESDGISETMTEEQRKWLEEMCKATFGTDPSSTVNDDGQSKSFHSTLDATMERLKQSSAKVTDEIASGSSDAALFAEMMKQFGGGEGKGDASADNLENLIESMVQQLMSKEVLYEPLQDLVKKYPIWLESKQSTLSKEEKTRYEKQYQCCKEIVKIYDSGKDDEEKERISELLQQMQECGAPPPEILQELAPGMELGEDGLPQLSPEMAAGMGGDQCNLM